MSTFLNEQEAANFKRFVEEFNLSYRHLAKLLHRKSQQGIFAALKKNRIKREAARMIREELKSKFKLVEGI